MKCENYEKENNNVLEEKHDCDSNKSVVPNDCIELKTNEKEIFINEPSQQENNTNVVIQNEENKNEKSSFNGTGIPKVINEREFCKYCGDEILFGNTYCSSCGGSTIDENVVHCHKCGTVLDDKQEFCSKCGTKITHSKKINKVNKKINKNKKSIKSVSIIFLVLVLVVTVGIITLPKIFASPYALMEQGKYEKAYNHANYKEKTSVLFENVIAKNCEEIKSNLKNTESFRLENVWIEESTNSFVLQISGTNSYGGTVKDYYYYTFDNDDNEYSLWITVRDFEKEKVYSFDDADERLEKSLKNVYKPIIKEIVCDDSLKVTNGITDRINSLNREGLLKNIELIDQVSEIYPASKESTSKL